MFFAKFMFVKKGPLAQLWLAAHNQKKLNKQQVMQIDIVDTSNQIIKPDAPLALRLSDQLLLGLVRIYQRKVRYLETDATEASGKIKIMLKTTSVDLPPDAAIAHPNAITLPDVNQDALDMELPDVPFDYIFEPVDDAVLDSADPMFPGVDSEPVSIGGKDKRASGAVVIGFDDEAFRMDEEFPPMPDDDVAPPDEKQKAARVSDGGGEIDDVARGGAVVGDADVPFDLPEMPPMLDEYDLRSPPGKAASDGVETKDKDRLSFAVSSADVSMAEQDAKIGSSVAPDAESEQQQQQQQQAAAAAVEEKKRKAAAARKRKMEQADTDTEISKEVMQKMVEDASDISLVQRPSLPPRKRQKMSEMLASSSSSASSSASSSISAFPVATVSHLLMAPDLSSIMQRSTSLSTSLDAIPARDGVERKSRASLSGDVGEDVDDRAREKDNEAAGGVHDQFDLPDFPELPDMNDGMQMEMQDGKRGGKDEALELEMEFPPADGAVASADIDTSAFEAADRELHEAGDAKHGDGQLSEREREQEREHEPELEQKEAEADDGDGNQHQKEDQRTVKWSDRTKEVYAMLKKHIKKDKPLSYNSVVRDRPRMTVVGIFYELLVLKTCGDINVKQTEPYADILVTMARSDRSVRTSTAAAAAAASSALETAGAL